MPKTPEQLLDLTQATIRAAQFCFLITQDKTGRSSARLMQPFDPEPDLTLWFGASPYSRKVQEIQRDERVTLAFSHASDGAYVTLSGSASLVTDMALRQHYWRDAFTAFWPAGPAGDDYLLIQCIPSWIEIMHLAQEVAPEPFGLRPARLERTRAGWVLAD